MVSFLKCFSSFKCQIVDWRKGHKEVCHPAVWKPGNDSNQGSSDSSVVAEVNQLGIGSYKFDTELEARAAYASLPKLKISDATNSSEELRDKNHENKVEATLAREGANHALEVSSSFSCASSTSTSFGFSDDNSVCDSISSNESDQLSRHFSSDADVDKLLAASTVNGVDQDNVVSPKFACLVESVDKFSSLGKLKQGKTYDAVESSFNVESQSDLVGKPYIPSSGFWTGSVDSVDPMNDNTELTQCSSEERSERVISEDGPSLRFSFNLSSASSRPSYEQKIELKGTESDVVLSAAEGTRTPGNGEVLENNSRDVKGCDSKFTNRRMSGQIEGITVSIQKPQESQEFNCSHSCSDNSSDSDRNPTSKDASSTGSLSSAFESGHTKEGISSTSHMLKSSKESRSLSSDFQNNLLPMSTLRSISIIQSSKVDGLHESMVPPQAAQGSSTSKHGFKSSMSKVVDQFRGPKLVKSFPHGVGNEDVDRRGYTVWLNLYI